MHEDVLAIVNSDINSLQDFVTKLAVNAKRNRTPNQFKEDKSNEHETRRKQRNKRENYKETSKDIQYARKIAHI